MLAVDLLLLVLLDLLLVGLHRRGNLGQINQWILNAERKSNMTPTSPSPSSVSLPTKLIPNVVLDVGLEELGWDGPPIAVIPFVLSLILTLSILEHEMP